jgi:predicted permease
MLSTVRHDVRYALRTWWRHPGVAIAAIVPIALGIGLNTAVFAVLNSFAWRPLPVSHADELVSIHQDFRGGPRRSVHGARALFSLPEYRAYQEGSRTLAGVMAYSRSWTVTVGREFPQEVDGIIVTCNYFDVLRVPPALGTGFTTANCGSPGAPPVVMLSHAFWRREFGGDPGIVNTPIVLNGHDVIVAGVAPEGFDGVDLASVAFFTPTMTAPLLRPELKLIDNAHVSWLTLIGRRRDDASLAKVRADVALVARGIDRQQAGRTTSLVVEPATRLSLPVARRNALTGAGIVMAAFGVLLLIAAANVANLLLARAAARTREMAIRLSVGATRGRLIQQLLTESLLIAGAGAACGSLLFVWAFESLIPWLLTSVPGAEPLRIDATLDRRVFWFALTLTAGTALIFGLMPALQAVRRNTHGAMKQDVSDFKAGRGWLRGALISAQVALCTTLLIAAGLLSHALYVTHTFEPGFDYQDVAIVSVEVRGPQYEKEAIALFREQWLEGLRRLPGVETIAHVGRPPLSTGRSQATFRIAGDPDSHVFEVNTVSPEFFDLLRMQMLRGRAFTTTETDAAVVPEATARRYWPDQEAIGRVIVTPERSYQIVGILQDAQVSATREAHASYVYLPAVHDAQPRITVLARTHADVEQLGAAVRSSTAQLDPRLVVSVRPLADNIGLLQRLSQIAASGAGLIGFLALSLASTGIYGVVAFVVSRRRREVGVRMALGARPRDVQRMMVGQTLRPVIVGLVVGLGFAAAGTRVLQAALFGVSTYDPFAFIAAPALMLAIATAAALLPTRHATRLSPMAVLQSD